MPARVGKDHPMGLRERIQVEHVPEVRARAREPVEQEKRLAGSGLLHVKLGAFDSNAVLRPLHLRLRLEWA